MEKWFLILMFMSFCIHAATAWSEDEISIEGRLLMLDYVTPHVAVPVQAIRNGEVIAAVPSSEGGYYRFINLKPGRYQVRCQVLGGYIYYGEGENVATEASDAAFLRVERGKILKDIDFHFAAFKKGTWRNYNTLDGLAHNFILAIYSDPDGVMWFGTWGGLSRYDGKEFVNFTTRDGLAHNTVVAIDRGPDGVMWFGTFGGGVSRYDGRGMGDSPYFVNFTTQDGLASNIVTGVHVAPNGDLWFGTGSSGVSRYDGRGMGDSPHFVNFTTEDGLASNTMHTDAIHCDPDGVVWFGTGEGLSRYDGKEFVNFTFEGNWNVIHDVYRDRDGYLWVGTRAGALRYDGKEFVRLARKDGLPYVHVVGIDQDPDGSIWFAIAYGPSGASRYDGKTFVNFSREDGLAQNDVTAVHRDPHGNIWFGTRGNGVSRYKADEFVTFTRKDGLADDTVNAICRDPDGTMWIGTGWGLSRYDGRGTGDSPHFVNFTTEDGLVNNQISAMCREPNGVMWIGTEWWGVSRYDRKSFVTFTRENGLAYDRINAIHRGSDGSIWFATGFGNSGGLTRYDGKQFVSFTSKDGLVHDWILSVHSDPDGSMWIGTGGGLSWYDGRGMGDFPHFVNFTTEDGLVNDAVSAIHRDPDGVMWFATLGGVSRMGKIPHTPGRMGKIPHTPGRYDGRSVTTGDFPHFVNFTTQDGLAHDFVITVYRVPGDVLWLGTDGGGVAMYDGTAWSSLDTRDGLAGNTVSAIDRDPDGSMWFGTNEGLTHYRRSPVAPGVEIVSVTADQTYRDLAAVPAFAMGTRITMEYDALDFKTVPEKRQYRCRINEVGARHASPLQWRKPTKATLFDYTFHKPGTYTFEVQAIDRDLNYSEPASLSIAISALPFYRTGIFLVALSIIGGGSLSAAIILAVHRLRSSRAERLRLQQELEDARQMQLRLLPESPPSIEGFDIAGFCRPAREVGGDFFDYLPLADGKIGIAIADVSGKGLKGAMNAVLTNGMLLHEVATVEASCGKILSALNADLRPRMEKQIFTAFGLAILSKGAKKLQWANAAQPYPMVRRGEQVFEFKSDGELPLGMMPNVSYRDWDLELQSGDTVIFYTDGIIEAENEAQEMYGTERLEQVMMHIDSTMDAEGIIETVLRNVSDFVGTAEQYDDMTVIVVKKL